MHAGMKIISTNKQANDKKKKQHRNFDKTKLRCHVCCDRLSGWGLSEAVDVVFHTLPE